MDKREDLRIKKTKAVLEDAFMALLLEKSLEEITVNELCNKAGIRRTTFYKHFNDKFDYIASFAKSLRARFDKIIWKSGKPDNTPDYYVMYAKQLVNFISRHHREVDNIISSPLFYVVMNILAEQNYTDTLERIKMSVAQGMVLSASAEVLASMLVGGVKDAVYFWLKSGKKKSADEISDEIGAIVRKCIG